MSNDNDDGGPIDAEFEPDPANDDGRLEGALAAASEALDASRADVPDSDELPELEPEFARAEVLVREVMDDPEGRHLLRAQVTYTLAQLSAEPKQQFADLLGHLRSLVDRLPVDGPKGVPIETVGQRSRISIGAKQRVKQREPIRRQ
jgi:hypothetical protein